MRADIGPAETLLSQTPLSQTALSQTALSQTATKPVAFGSSYLRLEHVLPVRIGTYPKRTRAEERPPTLPPHPGAGGDIAYADFFQADPPGSVAV